MKKIEIKKVYSQKEKTPRWMSIKTIKAKREDGYEFEWEALDFPETVHIFVNKVDTKEVLFTRQVRIPILVNYPETGGVCVECCAGVVDKDLPVIDIAREELREELGYDVPNERITQIAKVYSGLGFSGSATFMFYVEVTDEDYMEGASLYEEDIETVRIKYEDIDNMFDDIISDSTTRFMTEFCKNRL